jgi:hypothetical protein
VIVALLLTGPVIFFALLLAREYRATLPAAGVCLVEPGDRIIYRKQKVSRRPGRRAREVYAASQGDTYSYVVDKFWLVQDVLFDGRIEVTTRTGKHHFLSPADPNLRLPRLYERLRYRRYFPSEELTEP